MRKRVNLTGMRVGELTVLSYAFTRKGNVYWDCSCSCGEVKPFPKSALIQQTIMSCGCLKEDYLDRARYHKIRKHLGYTFLYPFAYMPRSKQLPETRGRQYWMTICTGGPSHYCGKFVRASTRQLETGTVRSCTACGDRHKDKLDLLQSRKWIDKDEEIQQANEKRLRQEFDDMHRRAGDPGTKYEHIHVCERWSGEYGFHHFKRDMKFRPWNTTLDRIDPHGDYTPENCEWATIAKQNRNKTNSRIYTLEDGQRVNQVDLANLVGIPDKKLKRWVDGLVKRDNLTPDQAAQKILFNGHCEQAVA